MVMFTLLGSMPRNQQRSQLSASYCTTSRKGGEVTTRSTDPDAICGVAWAGLVMSNASSATDRNVSRTGAVTSPSSCFDFLRMIFATLRGGGTWFRFSLIRSCDLTETAWFGGKVYTEKNPAE